MWRRLHIIGSDDSIPMWPRNYNETYMKVIEAVSAQTGEPEGKTRPAMSTPDEPMKQDSERPELSMAISRGQEYGHQELC